MSKESIQNFNQPEQKPRKLSLLALSSMIVSFIFIIPVVSGLTAIILGIVALYRIAINKDVLRGRGFAISGITLGLAQLLVLIILLPALLITPHFVRLIKLSSYYASNIISAPKKDYGCYVKMTEFALHNDKGVFLQKSGKPKEALKEYQKALEVAKKEIGIAHYGIGSSYMELKEYDKAIIEFDKAIKNNPMLYDAYQNKAVTYRLMGRFQDSVEACKKTISLFPDFARAYCSMGWAYEYLGDYDQAIKAHLKAITLAPEWKFPRQRIDHILSKIGNDQYSSEVYQEIKRITNKRK